MRIATWAAAGMRFLLLFLVTVPLHVAEAQFVMGARSVALGQTATALPGTSWAVFSNPALIPDERPSVSFFGMRYYGFGKLADMAVSFSHPAGRGGVGFGVHRYGFDLYSESRIRAGYKNRLHNFEYGIILNYNHVSIGGGYGSAGALGVDVGISARIGQQLIFGARATNLNRPTYGDSGESLPRELAIGVSCALSDRALFTSDIVKDVRFPLSFRAGTEVQIVEHITGRVGITTHPVTFAGGFGYSPGRWSVNLAAQNHPELGISPGLDMELKW